MKKIIVFLIALWMAAFIMPYALAETNAAATLEGVILEAGDDGSFLLDSTAMGKVQVKTEENTVLDGIAKPAVGQYVFVAYNGAMTKSLPPQVTASQVSCYTIVGTVLSVDAAAQTTLVESEEYGQVMVHLPDVEKPLQTGDFVRIYFSGVMAMSYPGQAGGLKVDVFTKAEGIVKEFNDGFFLLQSETGDIRVNIGEETQLPGELEEGDTVKVYYDGAMTKSLPPQVFGEYIVLAEE